MTALLNLLNFLGCRYMYVHQGYIEVPDNVHVAIGEDKCFVDN